MGHNERHRARRIPVRMVGKDPHRPEGKAKDAEHMGAIAHARDAPYQAPSEKEVAEQDLESKKSRGGPSRSSAFDPKGGARPGVGSRVQGAIEKRESREE